MFTKPNQLLICASALFTLSACAPQFALQGLPKVADGKEQRWLYHCSEGNIVVEYANRNAHYTALLSPDDSGAKVFDITTDGNAIHASWTPWQWKSADGRYFNLNNGETTVLSQCRAVSRQERGSIELDLSFGRE